MGRVERITKALKAHDSELFARRVENRIDIFRKNKRYKPFGLSEFLFLYSYDFPDHVFSLTDTWNLDGEPVEWGILPILARLKAMDLWSHEGYFREYNQTKEKEKLSSKKDFRNNIESFMSEWRPQFAKATNQFNTASLDKTKDSRRLRDGNCK